MSETFNMISEMPNALIGAMYVYYQRFNYVSPEQFLQNCLASECYSPSTYREWCEANRMPEKFTYNIHTTLENDWRPQLVFNDQSKKYEQNPQIILQGEEDQRRFYRGGTDRFTFHGIADDLHTYTKAAADAAELSMSKYVAIVVMGHLVGYPKFMDARINYWKDKKWTFADFRRRFGYDLTEDEYKQHCIDIDKFHPMVDFSREPVKIEQPWRSLRMNKDTGKFEPVSP